MNKMVTGGISTTVSNATITAAAATRQHLTKPKQAGAIVVFGINLQRP